MAARLALVARLRPVAAFPVSKRCPPRGRDVSDTREGLAPVQRLLMAPEGFASQRPKSPMPRGQPAGDPNTEQRAAAGLQTQAALASPSPCPDPRPGGGEIRK